MFLQNCTYYAARPPEKQTTGPMDNPVVLYSLLNANSTVNCDGITKFWVRNLSISSQASYCVSFTKKAIATGTMGVDFFEQDGLNSGLDFNLIASAYQNTIYPSLVSAFGEPSDVNKDKKVIILTLDILESASTGSSSGFVAGFVDPKNFEADDPSNVLRSNAAEILYMDGKELVDKKKKTASGDPDPFLATIAHEMQHLIRYQYGKGKDNVWIDEGTSEVSSDISGYGPQKDRISCFKGSLTSSCADTGVQGTSPFTWSGSLKNYAYSYAFVRYLFYAADSTSATDNTNRLTFLKNTVQGGTDGVRASTPQNLMHVFRSTKQYTDNKASVPADSSTDEVLFEHMMISFFGQAAGATDLSATNVFINGTGTDLSSYKTIFPLSYSTTYYPLPSGIENLNFYKSLSATSGATLSPGFMYVNSQTSTGASSATTVNLSSSHIIMNPSSTGSGVAPSIQSKDLNTEADHPIHLEDGATCITPHLILDDQKKPDFSRKLLF